MPRHLNDVTICILLDLKIILNYEIDEIERIQ